MAKITAVAWMIASVIGYIILFLGTLVAVNAQVSILGTLNYARTSDPQANIQNNAFFAQEKCFGKGNAMGIGHSIDCSSLLIGEFDTNSCNSVSGCDWQNNSLNTFQKWIKGWLVPNANVNCYGTVNLTHYNITGDLVSKSRYCTASGLQNVDICEAFDCQWINNTAQFTQTMNVNSNYNTASLWDVIVWVTTFQVDLGWGAFNWMISIMFYVLSLIFLASVIFMFMPF
jgi:hypothetical protein